MGKRGRSPENLTGLRSGMLTVEAMVFHKDRTKCKCRCDCGKTTYVYPYNIKNKRSKSCGCNRGPKGKRSGVWCGHKEISGTYWYQLQNNARKSKKVAGDFSISIEYAWALYESQDRKCALSGVPIVFAVGNYDYKNGKCTASLDRIDSAKGYVKENVQWVHKDVNRAKSDFSQDRFVEICKQVAKTCK